MEIHLHHDRDTAEGFRQKLLAFKEVLASRHGLLARRRDGGKFDVSMLQSPAYDSLGKERSTSEESAMAPPAMSGSSRPAAATGMATRL